MPQLTLPISQKLLTYRGSILSDDFELDRLDLDKKYHHLWRIWRRVTSIGTDGEKVTWDNFQAWDGVDVEFFWYSVLKSDTERRASSLGELLPKNEAEQSPDDREAE